MHPSRCTSRQQQRRIASHRTDSDSYAFFNLLTSDELFETVEQLLPDHRERLYSPTETLSMFLAQSMNADRSCQHAVNQQAIKRVAGGLSPSSTHTGGYCRARRRLPLGMISSLTCHIGQRMTRMMPQHWRWRGRRVYLVDGTTLTMPDTAANQARFPQQRSQKPGLGFPICRLVGITCLGSGALISAAAGHLKGKYGGEQSLLRSIQHNFQSGDIVMGDALYADYFFIADMQSRGVDLVMEQHGARRRTTDFRLGHRLGAKDHLITLIKPTHRPEWMSSDTYENAPPLLTVREFKAGGKVMVTTLLDEKKSPKTALKSLYKQRWQIELTLRDIKQTLGLSILSCKTPDMVFKEIWIYLLGYNLIRLMMAQSALLADRKASELSFKHCLQLWLCATEQRTLVKESQLYALLQLMAQQRVSNRPGRIEPRVVKRRLKPYGLLMKPRNAARAEVKKYGHPRNPK